MAAKTCVEIEGSDVRLTLTDGSRLELQKRKLPPEFLKWQSEARVHLFERLAREGSAAIRRMPAHLAVLATSGGGPFPANLATRGLGLLPKPELLEEVTLSFEEAVRAGGDGEWERSLPLRVRAARGFYAEPGGFDPTLLGGLEIFEGRTLANLKSNPLASLLFTGEAPRYPSHQVNGAVTLVDAGDPYYRFLLAARELFARDAFHLLQTRYPVGYLFHVTEVITKTPFSRA